MAVRKNNKKENNFPELATAALCWRSKNAGYRECGDATTLENHDVGPDQFVPVAEATRIINPIGRWVLQEASRRHNTWLASGRPAIPLAVNMSVSEFRNRDFGSCFQQLVQEHGIDVNVLQLELTKMAVMDDIEHAIVLLSELQALGIKILLDDFGTGHSSLAHLARLPLNKLKVDKSFISRFESDVASRAVTDAMLALGHTLNLTMVAERVESINELEYLQFRGCLQMKGYFSANPWHAMFLRLGTSKTV